MLIGLKMSEYVGTAGTVSEKDLIRAIPWKNSWLNIWNHQPVVPYITICWTILDIEIIGHVFCPSKKNPTVYIPSLYPILSQYCWLFIYSIYECAYYIYIYIRISHWNCCVDPTYIYFIYISLEIWPPLAIDQTACCNSDIWHGSARGSRSRIHSLARVSLRYLCISIEPDRCWYCWWHMLMRDFWTAQNFIM
jgi:hypothetical protein